MKILSQMIRKILAIMVQARSGGGSGAVRMGCLGLVKVPKIA